jgi:translation initiation factor IF-3
MMLARVNGRITATSVRVVDEAGLELGRLSIAEALNLARSRNVDLIEIDPEAEPPTCQVIDYGLYRWRLQQAQHDRAHD